MIVVRNIEEIKNNSGLAATIGFFDGVHQGHRFLIAEMGEMARKMHLPSAVITFAQHPRKVLQADFQPKLLNSFDEKIAEISTLGVDYCIVLDFTIGLSRLTAKEFLTSVLSQQWKVKALLIGYDHRFGRDRMDDFKQYRAYGQACGMEVIEASRFKVGDVTVSSSEIRRLLMRGWVEEAAKLLTYPYQLKGHIVGGHKIGRNLGFPTANMRIDEPYKVIPAIGVYAVRAYLRGEKYKGMLYIGNRPTLNNGDDITMEVHILDFSDDIYTNELTVSFIYYVRDDVRFNSLEELKAQLVRDRETIQSLLKNED
ncbi:riboflavin biosynthesis protein [Bacteroidia bacterium]|nr:riboflavin biosynthesis protein [Bacteroidia bacterium]